MPVDSITTMKVVLSPSTSYPRGHLEATLTNEADVYLQIFGSKGDRAGLVDVSVDDLAKFVVQVKTMQMEVLRARSQPRSGG